MFQRRKVHIARRYLALLASAMSGFQQLGLLLERQKLGEGAPALRLPTRPISSRSWRDQRSRKPEIRSSGREEVHYAHRRVPPKETRKVAGAEVRDRIAAREQLILIG